MLSGRMAAPDVPERFRCFEVDGVKVHVEADLLEAGSPAAERPEGEPSAGELPAIEPSETERVIEFPIPHLGTFVLRIVHSVAS